MSVWWWSVALTSVVACAGGNGGQAAQTVKTDASAAAQCVQELPDVVAEIDGKPVTREELQKESSARLVEAEVALYTARKEAIQELVLHRVVDAEAAKKGVTTDQLMETEVKSKVAPVTDAEVETFYKQNQARIQGSLEDVRGQIKGYLEQQKAAEATRAYLTDLQDKANVKILLPPHRVAVEAGDSPRIGSPTAPVQIIEFSDFQCPYCSSAAKTIDEVEKKYGDKVSIVYRHFPLPMHKSAARAAQAAECADDQGGFWKYHDVLFANQKPWTDDDFAGLAKQVGLDSDKLLACLQQGTHVATVEADIEAGKAAGMGGTPGFYVNGVVLNGAQPIEVFSDVIDSELAQH
jgi:protein-disulfide isomerase